MTQSSIMDNTKIIEEFRKNNGSVSGMFSGMQILLMTTKGAKSQKESVIPVAYSKEADKYVIAASKAGAPNNPSWYYNLLAHPQILVEVGSEKFQALATRITGVERNRLYHLHESTYPAFRDYQLKTTREIPIFILEKIN